MRRATLPLLALAATVSWPACGARGNLPDARVKPLPHALAAVLFTSCLPTEANPELELIGFNSIVEPSQPSSDDYACLDEHASEGCAALKTCFGVSSEIDPNCTIGCKGSTSISCYSGRTIELDCSKQGLSCNEGVCVASPDVKCDAAFGAGKCENGAAVNCDGYVEISPPCASQGLVCTEGLAGGEAACVGEGPACAMSGNSGFEPMRCEGNAAVTCVGDREHPIDCDEFLPGSTCAEAKSVASCTYGDACAIANATCDDTTVVLCDAGAVTRVDCTRIGFKNCENGRCVN